jgi:signal transduction histidine kinase
MESLRLSFRTRLAFWYTLLLAVTVLVLGFVIVTVSRVSVLNTVDGVLEGTGRSIFGVIEVDAQTTPPIKIHSQAPLRTPGTWVQIWQVMDEDGATTPHLLWASDSLDGIDNALDPDHLTTREPSYSSLTFNGQTLRVLTLPLFDEGDLCGVLQVATSTTYFAQMQQTLVPIILIAAVVAIFISLLMSVALAARAVRPIEKVTQAASHIVDARDLSTRLTVEDADEEMGTLIQVFNHMMERLEHVFDVQQRLINDVSHEMRTPLTSIIGNIEIMERYGVEPDSLQSIHQEAERLSRTVNELLLLVRADSGEISVDMTPLSLDTLLLEVYEQAHILMKGRSLKLVLEQIDPVRVRGNRDRLYQMLMNLVTNAIKFTPDNGSIRLSLTREGDQALLKVSDTGIGISPEDQDRIYDRFFQADPARLHRENDGAGLGLSIAKWVIDIHRGQIVVHSTIGEGTSFHVTLPALPPDAAPHDDLEEDWPEISRKPSAP